MSKPNTATFDRSVAEFFAPLAAKAKLVSQLLGDGVYEVQGKDFTIRIRRGQGHNKDVLVTLLPTAERPTDNADLSNEIGLGVVAEFSGAIMAESSFDTEEESYAPLAFSRQQRTNCCFRMCAAIGRTSPNSRITLPHESQEL